MDADGVVGVKAWSLDAMDYSRSDAMREDDGGDVDSESPADGDREGDMRKSKDDGEG